MGDPLALIGIIPFVRSTAKYSGSGEFVSFARIFSSAIMITDFPGLPLSFDIASSESDNISFRAVINASVSKFTASVSTADNHLCITASLT